MGELLLFKRTIKFTLLCALTFFVENVRGDWQDDIEETFNIGFGAVIGILVGIIVILITLSILLCFCCACCCFSGRGGPKKPKNGKVYTENIRSGQTPPRSNGNGQNGQQNPPNNNFNLPPGHPMNNQNPQQQNQNGQQPSTSTAQQQQPNGQGQPENKPIVGILRATSPNPVTPAGQVPWSQNFSNYPPYNNSGQYPPPIPPPKPVYLKNHPQHEAWDEINQNLKDQFNQSKSPTPQLKNQGSPLPDYYYDDE